MFLVGYTVDLESSTTEPQLFQYLKSVLLEIPNMKSSEVLWFVIIVRVFIFLIFIHFTYTLVYYT